MKVVLTKRKIRFIRILFIVIRYLYCLLLLPCDHDQIITLLKGSLNHATSETIMLCYCKNDDH